jgi:MFS family permease
MRRPSCLSRTTNPRHEQEKHHERLHERFLAPLRGRLTLISILACLVLLWISGTTKAATHADNTTGHVWDGDLKEMNNPLPKWWVYLFIITVVFGLVYGALYPMFGKYQGAWAGPRMVSTRPKCRKWKRPSRPSMHASTT